MKCQRCNGLMYRLELRDRKGFERLQAFVCVLCGDMVDSVIAFNRRKNAGIEQTLPKRAPRRRHHWKKYERLAVNSVRPESGGTRRHLTG